MTDDDVQLLNSYGWEVESESPEKIKHRDSGSIATGIAVYCVLMFIKDNQIP